MGVVMYEYKGYKLMSNNTLITPCGNIHNLLNVADKNNGKRGTMYYRGKRFTVYRVVMCIFKQVDKLPTCEIHHVDCNRHNCTLCNLCMLTHEAHIQAHKIEKSGNVKKYHDYIKANKM